jgi:hypothetical protein
MQRAHAVLYTAMDFLGQFCSKNIEFEKPNLFQSDARAFSTAAPLFKTDPKYCWP